MSIIGLSGPAPFRIGPLSSNVRLQMHSGRSHPASSDGTDDIVAIRGTVISNFAVQHLLAARFFRDKSAEIEVRSAPGESDFQSEAHRCYVTATVMSSVAALEALINELFIAHHSGLRERIPDFEKSFWSRGGIERKSILDKYSYALSLLGSAPINVKTPPAHNAWALIELRNALVHFKPIWDPVRDRTVELVEVLSKKYPLNPLSNDSHDFVAVQSMSAGCAKWAVQVVFDFLHDFDRRASIDQEKMRGIWAVEA